METAVLGCDTMWSGIRKPSELMYWVWKWKQIHADLAMTVQSTHKNIYGFGTERVKITTGGDYFLPCSHLKSSCHLIPYELQADNLSINKPKRI
jgi:hypothetical protein